MSDWFAIALDCDEIQKLLPSPTVLMIMEMHPKIPGQSADSQDGGDGRILNVPSPAAYDGLGNALRSSFGNGRDALPDDMLSLLASLDHIPQSRY